MNIILEKIIKEDLTIDEIYFKQISSTYSNDSLIDYIVNELGGIVAFKNLLKAKYGVTYFNEDSRNIEIIENIQNYVSYKQLNELEILPIKIEENILYVAVNDVLDYEKINKIKNITNIKIRVGLSKQKYIKSNLQNYYKADLINTITEKSNNISIEDLINKVLKYAVDCKASDIHIEPYEEETLIRLRIDGDLVLLNNINSAIHKKIISKLKLMSGIDIAKRAVPQDGHFKLKIDERLIDFRLSTVPTIFDEKAVLRIIYNDNYFNTKESIGFLEEDIKLINDMLKNSKGLILVTGSTGSGKSTTLSTFIKEMDYKTKNIITVEEPVENIIKGVTQINLNGKLDFTFDNTLEYILRQDPDVIMIGEIRNVTTAQFAIRSSITGHLVLSTLHTSNAISTISRLLNMGIENYLITSSLKGVISQRLVKKVCNNCKEIRKTTLEEQNILGFTKKEKVYFGVGCTECNGLGVSGRTIVYEILEINNEIRNKILSGKDLNDVKVKSNIYENIRKNVLMGNISIYDAINIMLEIRYDKFE